MVFFHAERDVTVVCHGDDFTIVGEEEELNDPSMLSLGGAGPALLPVEVAPVYAQNTLRALAALQAIEDPHRYIYFNRLNLAVKCSVRTGGGGRTTGSGCLAGGRARRGRRTRIGSTGRHPAMEISPRSTLRQRSAAADAWVWRRLRWSAWL